MAQARTLAELTEAFKSPTVIEPDAVLTKREARALQPTLEETNSLPDEFRISSKWQRFIMVWMYKGSPFQRGFDLATKVDIDGQTALNHISKVLENNALSSAHREVAAAWLLSLWFEDVQEDSLDPQ